MLIRFGVVFRVVDSYWWIFVFRMGDEGEATGEPVIALPIAGELTEARREAVGALVAKLIEEVSTASMTVVRTGAPLDPGSN